MNLGTQSSVSTMTQNPIMAAGMQSLGRQNKHFATMIPGQSMGYQQFCNFPIPISKPATRVTTLQLESSSTGISLPKQHRCVNNDYGMVSTARSND